MNEVYHKIKDPFSIIKIYMLMYLALVYFALKTGKKKLRNYKFSYQHFYFNMTIKAVNNNQITETFIS